MNDESSRHLSLDRVIRRATELQMAAGHDEEDGLTDDEILRIGREVGLETTYLKRALGELRAEARLTGMPEEDGWLSRVVGPGHVQAHRVVAGEAGRIEERLSDWMVERESLYPVRRRSGVSLWAPSEGIAAQFKRSFSWQGHRYELARVPEVEMTVQALEDGWVLVTLQASLARARRQRSLNWIAGLPLGLTSTGVGAVLLAPAIPAVWVVLPVAAGLGAGMTGGVWGARAGHQEEVLRVTRAMEGILDRLERGEIDPHAR